MFGIERIGNDRSELVPGVGRQSSTRDGAQVAAAAGRDRAGVLLRRVHPVRIRVVDGDVIDLRGRLVVPGAPRVAAVERNGRPLIDAEEHPLAVGRIDPHHLRIVAARRTLERGEGVAAVERAITRRRERIHDVRIAGIDEHAGGVVPLAVGDAAVVRGHAAPRIAAIIGAVQSESADDEHPLRVGVHRDGNAGAPGERGQAVPADLLPRHAFIGGLEEFRVGRPDRSATPAPASSCGWWGSRRRCAAAAGCERIGEVLHRRRKDDVGMIIRIDELLDADGVTRRRVSSSRSSRRRCCDIARAGRS